MTRDAPTFQHGRVQMQCSLTSTLRPEVISNVGPSVKRGIILSKLHIPSSDMASSPNQLTVFVFLESARALASTQ